MPVDLPLVGGGAEGGAHLVAFDTVPVGGGEVAEDRRLGHRLAEEDRVEVAERADGPGGVAARRAAVARCASSHVIMQNVTPSR